jgi:predicted flavoprotein YhiN
LILPTDSGRKSWRFQSGPQQTGCQYFRKEMQKILENLCKKKFQVTGKSTFKDEFVTAGGVDLKEINFKNMSSKFS